MGTYTYGNALVRKDAETPLFDGLGSERAETSSSGGVTATLTTAAFGQTVASTGTTASAYGFGATSGYRSDGDAGLTHVGARYYDAQVGRFITRDTDLDQRPYAYCDGDPVNNLDPSGHEIDMNAGGVVLGAVAVLVTIAVVPEALVVGGVAGVVIGIGTIISGIVGAVGGNQFGNSLPNPTPTECPAPSQQEIKRTRLRAEEYKASGGVIDF